MPRPNLPGIPPRPITGTGLDDILDLTDLPPGHLVIAGDGDDTILGAENAETIRGGGGLDTAVFAGSIFDYDWSEAQGNQIIVAGETGGTTTLQQVERMQFDDYTFVFGGANAPLIRVSGTLVTDEETPVVFKVSTTDFDGDVSSLSVWAGGPYPSTLTSLATSDDPNGYGEMFSWDPNGAFEHLGVDETDTVTISVLALDDEGNQSYASYEITIEGVNDAPEITAGGGLTRSVAESGTQVTGHLSAYDVDGDSLSYSVLGGGDGDHGSLSIDENGNWTYLVDAAAADLLDALETGTDEFMFEVSDGNGGSAQASLTINVIGEDDSCIITGPSHFLTFEDLGLFYSKWADIPTNYQGLVWSNSARVMETDELWQTDIYDPDYGYSACPVAATSGHNVLYTYQGNDLEISRNADFRLVQAQITSCWIEQQTLTVEGWNDGALVGSQEVTITTDGPQLVQFAEEIFGCVDAVHFSTPGTNYTQFLIDDLMWVG